MAYELGGYASAGCQVDPNDFVRVEVEIALQSSCDSIRPESSRDRARVNRLPIVALARRSIRYLSDDCRCEVGLYPPIIEGAMGSIKRRLGLLWATFLLSLGPFVGLLYNDPGAFGGQLQKYFILWAIMVVGYSLYLLFSFQPSGTLSPASKFVEAIASSADEYCLILRPFGADGFVPLRVALPQGSMRETLLKPVALSKTLEAVVEAEARTALGCQSVALVDPKLKIVPLSPTYIAADNDAWQGIVDKLLRRALIAVVILPPGQRARGALRWEVGRAIEMGLLGRLVFVLPPPQVEGYAAARATLDDLQSVLPGLERAPGNSIVVYPHDSSNFEWFFLNGVAGDVTYIEAFRKVLARVKTTFTGTSFLRRYPHAQQNRLSVMPKSN